MGRTKGQPSRDRNADENRAQCLEFRPRFKKFKRRAPQHNGYNILQPNDKMQRYYVGMLWVGTSNNVMPEKDYKMCKASFLPTEEKLKLLFDNCFVIVNITTDYEFLKSLILTKIFAIKFESYDQRIFAKLYISQLPLKKFTNKIGKVIKTAFALIFNIPVVDCDADKKNYNTGQNDIQLLYESVHKLHKDEDTSNVIIDCSRLNAILRPYQERAVRWMIIKEKRDEQDILHPLYQKITLESGIDVYFDRYTGHLEETAPVTKLQRNGAILADEMGLGKTIEVLACILSHPKTNLEHSNAENLDDDELCPTVTFQPKRRKIKKVLESDENPSENDIQPVSGRGVNKIALRNWYEKLLEEVSVKKRKTGTDTDRVHCICGEPTDRGIVCCTACYKRQHSTCLGYDESLGKYLCPQCWMNQPLLESKATLIVCPASLRKQWLDEICRHVKGNLKIMNYQGSSVTPVYPTQLQAFDVVLTTYSVLQADLRLSENGKEFQLRNRPKYSAPGSPITRIKWWRLCLDEAQTVETSKVVSEMTHRLHADHRWAVTGTPICKDVTELHALLDYLQLLPYSEVETWTHILYNPYLQGKPEPMYKFLSQIMWRSAKKEVIQEINIPKQTMEEHFLEFSAVEKYFYKREHQMCCVDFLSMLRSFDLDAPLVSLDRRNFKRVLAPLLALRQACTHPNAVRGRYLATRKQVTSMEELLDALIVKNVSEGDECLRLVVSALNGLAGLYLLLQNPIQAVEEYRKVLHLASRFNKDEDWKHITVDNLQLIHTMHNLAEVLATAPPVPPTLRDTSLSEDCLKLEKKYMDKYISQTKLALEESSQISASVTNLQKQFIFPSGKWYSTLLEWVATNDLMDELMTRIRVQHENSNVTKMMEFSNERRILYLIATWEEEICRQLETVTHRSINKLYTLTEDGKELMIPKKIVEMAADCHLRPQKNGVLSKKCAVCTASDNLNQYEYKLFCMEKKDKGKTTNTGAWKPSTQELALKSIYLLGKARNVDNKLLKDGKTHLKLIQATKKEFQAIRKLWTFLDQQICAQDELNMCKIRLQLQVPGTEERRTMTRTDHTLKKLTYIQENRLQTIHMLKEVELDYHRVILQSEEKDSMSKLEKCLGTSSYLETVRLQQYSGQNPDPCPVCKTALQDHWSLLPCGHCYCLECIETLLSSVSGACICCPVCREKQKITDISYIKNGGSTKVEDEIQIVGNYSSKIEAIIRLVFMLKNENPDVKVLIFSTWVTVLKSLQTALEMNKVSTVVAHSGVETSVQKFKDENSKITALLLPVHLGSKGLNLIEATHVILVEPLLNPGDELQAVGRVHRIGQTKPTVVHKFIIQNTIEYSIHQATSSNAENWDKNKITLNLLKGLFIDPEGEDNSDEVSQAEPTEM